MGALSYWIRKFLALNVGSDLYIAEYYNTIPNIPGADGNLFVTSTVGIQKHFVGIEISGFDLSNRFYGLATSLFSRDSILNYF